MKLFFLFELFFLFLRLFFLLNELDHLIKTIAILVDYLIINIVLKNKNNEIYYLLNVIKVEYD